MNGLNFFKLMYSIITVICLSCCNANKKASDPCTLTIDSPSIINGLSEFEIYMIRCKGKSVSEGINNLLNLLNINEIYGCEAVSYYNYQLIINQPIRDSIYIAYEAKKILLVAKSKDKVLLYKIVPINNKNIRSIGVKLFDQLIKVTVD